MFPRFISPIFASIGWFLYPYSVFFCWFYAFYTWLYGGISVSSAGVRCEDAPRADAAEDSAAAGLVPVLLGMLLD